MYYYKIYIFIVNRKQYNILYYKFFIKLLLIIVNK